MTNQALFWQLRDVEIIIQERLAMPDSDVTKNERDTLLKIQTILYSTEVRSLPRTNGLDSNVYLSHRRALKHRQSTS